MGNLFREYQLPVLLSEDLESGGPPIRVKLLGEDLLAFRTLEGQVGWLASLFTPACITLLRPNRTRRDPVRLSRMEVWP